MDGGVHPEFRTPCLIHQLSSTRQQSSPKCMINIGRHALPLFHHTEKMVTEGMEQGDESKRVCVLLFHRFWQHFSRLSQKSRHMHCRFGPPTYLIHTIPHVIQVNCHLLTKGTKTKGQKITFREIFF